MRLFIHRQHHGILRRLQVERDDVGGLLRERFARYGLAGVADAPRSGKPRHYEAKHRRRIIAALDAPPPAGYARWNGPLLAKHLGDISKHQIWRVLRAHEISLERRRSWCISTDPALVQVNCPATRTVSVRPSGASNCHVSGENISAQIRQE